ncbi:MAG: CerR family C-terminal domain-containing protein [Deltaproteobacteria bacterium]|nr:CerR family C-terminal domain-containing protein [Deltaproteobacteria bacterium]
MENKTRQSSETRQRLLMAAYRIFAENGYRQTTVRDICQEAQVNVAAVNYHFGDKEKLYLAVCKAACGISEDKAPDPTFKVPTDAAPEEKLRVFVQSFLQHIMTAPRPDPANQNMKWKLMAREMNDPTPGLSMMIKEMIRPRFLQLSGIVRDFLGEGCPDSLVRSCCFSIVGQCLHYRFSRHVVMQLNPEQKFDEKSIQQIAGHIVSFSLHGLQGIAKQNTEYKSQKPE